MDLSLTEEQEAIRTAFAGFFAKESSPERVRAAEPLGFDAEAWSLLVDMGAPGIGVADSHGGGDAGMGELALVAEEQGRRLAPVPFVEAATSARLLARAADAAATGPGALDGAALADLAGRATVGQVLATFSLRPAHRGVARLVPAGAVADVVIVLDDGAGGPVLVALESPPPGTGPPNLAAAPPLADRPVTGGTRTVLATGDAVLELHRGALDEWMVLTAASLVGLADEALGLAVRYVKEREQFGVPIGSFQAIQHGLADAVVALDGAHLLVGKAAWAIDDAEPTAPRTALMAFQFATETAQLVTQRSLQYHGGYGFMNEYDIQLYHRRARGWPLLAGDPVGRYQVLADRLFGPRRPARKVG